MQTKSLTFPGRDLSVCHQMDQVSTSYTGICDKLNNFNLSLLLSIVASTLHIVHKVFLKAFESSHWMWIILHLILMPGLFDRHENPAKKKICYSLLKAVSICCETLFLRHVNSWWLTLTPALRCILEEWDDGRKYFLVYLANGKTKKRDLTINKSYKKTVEALKCHNKVLWNGYHFIFWNSPSLLTVGLHLPVLTLVISSKAIRPWALTINFLNLF